MATNTAGCILSETRKAAVLPVEERCGVFEAEHRFVILDVVVIEKVVDVVDLFASLSVSWHVQTANLARTAFVSCREHTSCSSSKSIVTHSKPSMRGYGSFRTLAGSSGLIGPSSNSVFLSSRASR